MKKYQYIRELCEKNLSARRIILKLTLFVKNKWLKINVNVRFEKNIKEKQPKLKM